MTGKPRGSRFDVDDVWMDPHGKRLMFVQFKHQVFELDHERAKALFEEWVSHSQTTTWTAEDPEANLGGQVVVGSGFQAVVARDLARELARSNASVPLRTRIAIEEPFGSRVLRFFSRYCSGETYTTVFAQIVADRREEINADLAAGRHDRIRWIKARGCYDLAEATIAVIATRLLKTISVIRKLIG